WAEPLPASRAHANDIVRPLLANLADRVQSVLRVVALDPNLMSTFTPNRRKLHRIHGAMLLVVDEVLLRGGQSLLNRCLVSSHQNPPCVALNTGTARLHSLSGANPKKLLFRSFTGFDPEGSFGSIHSFCLSALVTDRAMETWYHPPLHE